MLRVLCRIILLITLLCSVYGQSAYAVPSSTEVERIQPLKEYTLPDRSDDEVVVPDFPSSIHAPEGAEDVPFVVKSVKIEGATAFSEAQLKEVYAEYLNQEKKLNILWIIAGRITQKYREEGYFLSRSYVPAQEIESGDITINIVEGYVSQIEFEDGELSKSELIADYNKKILNKKPIKSSEVENFLLRINDLPGVRFRSVIKSIENIDSEEGAVKLLIIPTEEDGKGVISIDNFGSRFLGQNQMNFGYQDSIIPLQMTSFRFLAAAPTKELKYGALSHQIPILSDLNLEISGSYVKSAPDYNIEADMIRSNSVGLNLKLNYQAMRQRQENLAFSFELDGKNTNSNILGSALTRDRVRAARLTAAYDTSDSWDGYNYFNLIASKGLDILSSSQEGDLNLSRGEAKPDFTKLEFRYNRFQGISDDILAVLGVSGQLSSTSLYSSEEFGIGGQSVGRAYDPSEITGDEGFATSAELRYTSFDSFEDMSITPYVFYDIGRVFNDNASQISSISLSSAGFGAYASHEETGLLFNLAIAQPLTKTPEAPQSGSDKNPRFLFSVSKQF